MFRLFYWLCIIILILFYFPMQCPTQESVPVDSQNISLNSPLLSTPMPQGQWIPPSSLPITIIYFLAYSCGVTTIFPKIITHCLKYFDLTNSLFWLKMFFLIPLCFLLNFHIFPIIHFSNCIGISILSS